MTRRTLASTLERAQKGITGIETAIILIAFVVVASVFSYVAISSGLFATQKSQEAIYKGVQQAEGAVMIKGGLILVSENPGTAGTISQIIFTVSPTMRGNPIDFTPPSATGANNGHCAANSQNRVVVSYYDQYSKIDDLYWTVTRCGYDNGDNLLDEGEMFQITIGNAVHGAGGGNLLDALAAHPLSINSVFTVQVTTALGSTLTFERTTPAFIDGVTNLH